MVVASDSGIDAGAIPPMGLEKILRVQEVCAGAQVGHGQLPSDPRVTAMVVQVLGPERPGLATSDCARAVG